MSQPQQVNIKIKGLYTSPNDFSGSPEGALEVGDDIVCDYENVAQSRRGYDYLTGSLSGGSDRVNSWTTYQAKPILQYGTSSLAYYTGSAYSTYSGSYIAPDSLIAKVRFFQANQNLYISTSTGVRKLDAYNGTPVAAGVPKGLDLQLSLTGASGFFETNEVTSITGTTSSGSPTLSVLSSTTGIAAGQYISGTGITTGTTVSSITPSATVATGTVTTAIGSTTITAINTTTGFEAQFAANQFITGTGIPTGTRIVSVNTGAHTAVISLAATQAGSPSVTLSSDATITMSANATASGIVTLVFSEGSQVGYRILFGFRDANNNLLYGAPSQFTSLTNNTGVSANVSVTFSIPAGITTSYFYQVYRTDQTGSAAVQPQDIEQLVYEGNPSSGEISAKVITLTDNTPDSLRGAFLYTSSNQEGILQSNAQPPFCKDFCAFRDFAIYVNVKSKQLKKITMLAVGSPNGVQANDTITIAGTTYTAKTAENSAAGEFKVFTTGTPAQNISDTTNSLIKVINRYATNTLVYATLISGPNDLPGQLLIEERSYGGASFALTASRGASWSPTLPTSGTTVSSAQDIYKNGVMLSKSGQPEAVPTTNLQFSGDASKEILRVIPTREYVFFLTEGGIYRGTGDTPSTFLITPFDLTTNLICPDSAVALSNQVFGFFDQNVCAVSDTGVRIISRPIELDLRELVAQAASTVRTLGFGIAYETDRKYILSLPTGSGDTFTRQQYIYHLTSETPLWTRWTREATSGYINSADDKLYWGDNTNKASKERKTYTNTDFVDEAFDVTITAVSGSSITLSSVVGITAGDVLYQSGTINAMITDVDSTLNTVTVFYPVTFTTGTRQVLVAINNVIQWKPLVAGNPFYVRHYSEGALLFKRKRFVNCNIGFFSDISQNQEDTEISGNSSSGWGTFPWGTVAWGGVARQGEFRFLVPQTKQMCSLLTPVFGMRNGYSDWILEGVSISYNPVNQEVG